MFGLECTRLPANFSLHFSALLKTVFVVLFVGALQAAAAPVSSASPPSDSASVPSALTPLALPTGTDTPTHDATVGTLAGQAGVDGGAATYTVPIEVPPGRAGMQPALTLNYNSRNGNGVMGVGWTLSGTSAIHRCPNTPEQDGQTLGVQYASSDRLCLDGQRLVAVAGSSYGVAGAEYRTEIDSYARILQVAASTGSGTCFRVEQKDGRILHYGGIISGASPTCVPSSVHSQVQPSGLATGTTLSWLVEKIEDRVGNNQLYAYSTPGNGEVLLSTVTYTGFTTTPGDRTVTFLYQARAAAASGATDISSSYLGGGLTMQTMALQSITTRVGSTVARVYQPSYTVAAYSGRLLMNAMQECAGSGCLPTQTACTTGSTIACHPATVFRYNDSPLQYTLTSLSALGIPAVTNPVGTNPVQITVIGDLDGDGTREAVATTDSTHIYLLQMTADRVAHAAYDLTGTGFSSETVDIDGDGRAEQVQFPVSAAASPFLSFNTWKPARSVIVTPSTTPSVNFPS